MVSFIAPNAMTTIRGLPSRRNPNSPASPHSSTSVMDRSSPAFRELQRRGLVESSPNDNPVQRCRFSVPKCITKAMKAIGNFFRAIFNRFRSDSGSISEGERTINSLPPIDADIEVGGTTAVMYIPGDPTYKQGATDCLKSLGVSESDVDSILQDSCTSFKTSKETEYEKTQIDNFLRFKRTK